MMEISSKNNIRKRISTSDHVSNYHLEDEEMKDVALPGFRFHPTDEELIGFYLRRKVDNKPLTIQLIKQIDIYKYDPWDLPKVSSVGEKEWYFFCKRGRKYKNSVRPNRVTGSGFWKATGIDKPVHSNLVNYGGSDSDHHQEASDHQYRCIGLKKTLVYYRGSAGKGTKTDWMMHEFRLPSTQPHNSSKTSSLQCSKTIINHDPQEAEIWTLCRILKRNAAYKKLTPHRKELSAAKRPFPDTTSLKHNNNMVESNNRREAYNIDFSAPMNINQDEKKPAALNRMMINNENIEQYNLHVNQFMNSSSTATQPISVNSFSCSSYDPQDIDFFTYGNWDELRSVVDFALNPMIT